MPTPTSNPGIAFEEAAGVLDRFVTDVDASLTSHEGQIVQLRTDDTIINARINNLERDVASLDTATNQSIDNLAELLQELRAEVETLDVVTTQQHTDDVVAMADLRSTITALATRVTRLEAPVVVVPPPPVPTLPPAPPTTTTLVRGTQQLARSTAPTPSVGGSVTQATTGQTIRRVATGLIDYSRFTRVSVDNKYLMVFGENSTSMKIVERATGNLVKDFTDIGEYHEPRWHYVDGAGMTDTFYYVKGNQFRNYKVGTGTDILIRDFTADLPAGTTRIANDVEGDSSNDSRYWCWMALKMDGNGDFPLAIFTYDMRTNTILGKMLASQTLQGINDASHSPPWRMNKPNMVEIAPDGSGALIHWDRKYAGNNGNLIGTTQDGPHIYPLNLVQTNARRLAVDATHSAWAMDLAGKWHLCSQDNRTDRLIAVPVDGVYSATGNINMMNVAAVDTDWSMGFHFAKSYTKKGYVLVSTYSGANADGLDDQIFFLPLVNNAVPLRVCDTYSLYPGDLTYRNEASASLSYDGNGVYWTSNWMGTMPRSAMEVRLPANWG